MQSNTIADRDKNGIVQNNDIDKNNKHGTAMNKNIETNQRFLESNQKESYWDSRDSPKFQKQIALFPSFNQEREHNFQNKQMESLKTSSSQLFHSEINLLQKTQMSQEIKEAQTYSNQEQQHHIPQAYASEVPIHKKNKLKNIQTITEISSCINNSQLNNDILSPNSQFIQTIQDDLIIGSQKLNISISSPQQRLIGEALQQNFLQQQNNIEDFKKDKQFESRVGSEEDLVQNKQILDKRKEKNQQDFSNKMNKNMNQNKSNIDVEKDGLLSSQIIKNKKSLTEKIFDKINNMVNGSQNQVYAEEDKPLQNDSIYQDHKNDYSPINLNENFNQCLQDRKSIRLFTPKYKRTSQVNEQEQQFQSSHFDFDEVINQNRTENVGVKRRTYTEFNSLMKQGTREYDFEFKNHKDEVQEDDDQEIHEEKSEIDSVKGSNNIGQTEQQMQKSKSKNKKYKRKKKAQAVDENGEIKVQKPPEEIKYDYPFPYNLKIRQKEDDEQFRHVDDDLKEEYEFYSKKQTQKQEKNNELIIYATKKNEFEMLTIMADTYPLLQVRKGIILICKLISWIAYKIIKHRYFERIVLFVIIFNTIMQCMDDPTSDESDPVQDIAYTIECGLKILGLGFVINKGSYLRDGWNILDFTIVVTSLLPYVMGSSSGVNLSSLRSLRVLRPLKTISKIRSLRIVLLALFSSFPYLVNAIIILFFFYLIFAIAGVQLFMGLLKRRCFNPISGIILTGSNDQPCGGQYDCPTDYVCGKMFDNPIYGVFNFDNILSSFLMVFVCVTLESWTQIMYYVFDSFSSLTVVYFVVLAFVGAFFLINLTLAVIKAKFTKPEDVEEEQEVPLKPDELIDMHRLKMFRRMERSHLKRKLLEKKQILMTIGAQENEVEQGIHFNWEDLIKLKMLQDKEDEQIAKKEAIGQQIEKQMIMKEKLKQKLKKAINKDSLFKQNRLDSAKGRQLPNQKIVFYVGKEQGEVTSQATINEQEGHQIHHHHSHHHNQTPNHSIMRGSIRFSSKNYGHKIGGMMEKQYHNNNRQSKISRQSSIQSTLIQPDAVKQKKELQQIAFLGVQRGSMTPLKQRDKQTGYYSNNSSVSNINDSLHKSRHHRSSQTPLMNMSVRNRQNTQLVNEEDDQKIFDRFDEINKLEIEEYKRYEKENGRVDMDEFTVINNQNLKRLRKLPDIQTSLSILSLKQPKIRNSIDKLTQNMSGYKNLKSIITEDDFIKTPILKNNFSAFTKEENTELYDQFSKQITKSSTSDIYQNNKESFAKLNQKLQEIHEMKNTNNSFIITTTGGVLTTDFPLNNQSLHQIKKKQIEQQEINFQNIPYLKTEQNGEQKHIQTFDKQNQQYDIQKTYNQQNAQEDDKDSTKSLGIIDYESIDDEEMFRQRKFSSNSMRNVSVQSKSPAATPSGGRKSIYSTIRRGNSTDELNFSQTEEIKEEKFIYRDSINLKPNQPIIYNDEEEEDEEDIWVEQNLPVRPSTILQNIQNYQLNTKKVNPDAINEEEEDPQQTDRSKKSDRKSSKLNDFGRMRTLIQIQLNKKKVDGVQNQKHLHNNDNYMLNSVQTSVVDPNDLLNPYSMAQRVAKKKNTQKRLSRASVSHPQQNLETLLEQRQTIGQNPFIKRSVTLSSQNKKNVKPEQNVRHWKIMIDMKKQYKSNSSSDILYHRLKADQDNKIEEEQVKIRNMKYILSYRLRAIKKLNKKLLQKMKKEKKKRQKALKSQRGAKSTNRSDRQSKQKSGSAQVSDTDSSYNQPSSMPDNSEFSIYSIQDELANKYIRIPFRKNTIQDQLSSSAPETFNEDNQSIGSLFKIQSTTYQINSFGTKQQQLMKVRIKSRQARAAQSKEKIVLSFQNIKKLMQENVVREQIKLSLDTITNKAVFWDIRRIDYNLGIKNMNIWSGQNVSKLNKKKSHTNKILKQLCTETQDLHVWVAGKKGVISVIHKHYKNFILSNAFNGISMLCVFLNTTVLALNGTFTDQQTNDILTAANEAFSIIFIIEMGLKIIAYGPLGYVRDKINLFDGLIVSISIIEMIVFSGGSKAVSAFRAVRIFRTFRVLRVTRLLRGLEFMATIMSVINRTIDSFMYIALLLFLFIFIYSLLGMNVYGGQLNFDDNGGIRQNYDSFFNSFLCTFQIVTLENWTDILIKAMRSTVHPAITSLYLISWIFIGNYVFLNLFLAILLDGFVAEGDEEEMYRDQSQLDGEGGGDESDIDEQIQTTILKMTKKQIREEKKKQSQEQEFLLDIKQQQEQFEIDSETQLDAIFEDKKEAKIKLFHKIECRDSLFIFSKQSKFRILCYKIAQSHKFENIILVLIITSSLKLVVDTYLNDADEVAQAISEDIDIVFNSIFTMESVIKIIAYGLFGDENSYLTDTWSQLDFFIVLASLLDMSVASINLPVIKILRLLRTLRPLRFISHNVNMKVVVIALFESVGAIANVLVVVLLIWLMFAILGMSLIGDRMGYCGVTDYYGINQATCLSLGKSWKVFETNFDNISNSMITLLVLSTLENWPNMMFQAQDSDTADSGPKFMNYSIISFYYIFFILVGSFFLINLFIGVIFLKFTEAQKSQKTSIFLTDKQARWIEFQMMIIGVKAQFSQNKKPENKFRLIFWKLVNLQIFDIFIMLCIVANIVTMGLQFEGQSLAWQTDLQYVNYFFTAVFISEMLLKILSTGFAIYLQNAWNKFDFFVVCSSIIDISMDLMGGQSLSFLRVGPQLARVVRVFRVTRLLKLVKSMRGLQKLIETLVFSLPSLVNVGALMLLFFFIFSVLGVFLFKDIEKGTFITTYNNFQNFGNAMITLFRCSTGENWQYIMFDVGNQNNCKQGGICYTSFARIYFVFFILVCVFVMLNLFILVLIQYFEDYHMKEDNPLDAFNENLEVFRSVWAKYTAFSSGMKINHKQIVNFLSELPTPLGYYEKENENEDAEDKIDKHQIAKDVMEMKLADDGFGCVFFNDCLFACMKKAYGAEIVNEGAIELKKFLIKQEYETKKKIEEKKRQILIKQKQKIFNNIKNQHINPIVLMLFCGMAFKSWRNYQEKVKGEDGEVDKEYSITSSSSSQYSESEEENEQDIDDEEKEYQQEYDEDGNPIEISVDNEDEIEENEDQMNKQLDSQRPSLRELEDIKEKEEEDEEEDENTKIKIKEQSLKLSEKKSGKIKELSVQIPNDIRKREEQLNMNKSSLKNQDQGQNENGEKKQPFMLRASKSLYYNSKFKGVSSSDSKSSEESEKEVVMERAGYDENEDFAKIQEKNKLWKEKELKIAFNQNLLNDEDKDQGHNFLKTPKYFDDDVDNTPIEEIDTPIQFKKQRSKSKKKRNKNKHQDSF